MISRPGVRIGLGIEAGVQPLTLEIAQYAGRPLLLGLGVALVIAVVMRETYPGRASKNASSNCLRERERERERERRIVGVTKP